MWQAKQNGGLEAGYTQLHALLGAALKSIEGVALQLERDRKEEYLGLDASIAPALERPNMAGVGSLE